MRFRRLTTSLDTEETEAKNPIEVKRDQEKSRRTIHAPKEPSRGAYDHERTNKDHESGPRGVTEHLGA